MCKKFFLTTLCISQKPIYNVHLKKDDTGIPHRDLRGTHIKDRTTKQDKDQIRAHIERFPHVESHYCRARSNKKYLDPTLNIQKMYDLYLEECNEQQKEPQKICLYRRIFNYEFNLEFLKPKTDRCDIYEEHRLAR
ncbi:hypothetical protein NQ314_004656 [Rhamnusium bicolor]|uniref:Uncharacterized protein n=1 Tax=Rhamnusium bicolor TaxID=1586634 RepID=A0AAV8ZKM5_9CUCU|nr:hypothetical protein NQ314_004656 [Rhamnusium bicolor]